MKKARYTDGGMTLVEILVVLAIIGVMASVLELSVSGGSRNADVLEREATVLSTRLERAASIALLDGRPAGFVWDGKSYGFVSLKDGAWTEHSDGILALAHELDVAVQLSVFGRQRGQYLIRPDMLPTVSDPDTNQLASLRIDLTNSQHAWRIEFDGVSAMSLRNPAGIGS